MSESGKAQIVSIRMPDKWVLLLDILVLEGFYFSRNEVIRSAMIEFFKNDLPKIKEFMDISKFVTLREGGSIVE